MTSLVLITLIFLVSKVVNESPIFASPQTTHIELSKVESSDLEPACNVNYATESMFDFGGFEASSRDQLIASWDPEKAFVEQRPTFTIYSNNNPENVKAVRVLGRAIGWAKTTNYFYYVDEDNRLRALTPRHLGEQSSLVLSSKEVNSSAFKRLIEQQTLIQSSDGFAIFADYSNNTLSALNMLNQKIITIKAKGMVSFGIRCDEFGGEKCTFFVVTRAELADSGEQFNYNLIYATTERGESKLYLGHENPTIISISGELIHYLARGQGYRSLWVAQQGRVRQNLTPDINTDFVSGRNLGSGRLMLTDFFGQSTSVELEDSGLHVRKHDIQHTVRAEQLTFLARGGESRYLIRTRVAGRRDQIELVDVEHRSRKFLTCSPAPRTRGVPLVANRGNHHSHGFWFPPRQLQPENGSTNQPQSETLIYFHGGPAAAEDGWSNWPIQKLNDLGVGVIAVNYPFSPGYGDDYLIMGRLGPSLQAQSGIDLLTKIQSSQYVTLGKTYLLGVSYGGIPVTSSLLSKKHRFDGAILLSSVCNLNSDLVGAALPQTPKSRPEFGPLNENKLAVSFKSQYFTSIDYNGCNLQSVNAPIYAVVGTADRSNIRADILQMSSTAQIGKIVMVPDQGHALNSETVGTEIDTAIKWFRDQRIRQ